MPSNVGNNGRKKEKVIHNSVHKKKKKTNYGKTKQKKKEIPGNKQQIRGDRKTEIRKEKNYKTNAHSHIQILVFYHLFLFSHDMISFFIIQSHRSHPIPYSRLNPQS
jgi:hypothetical protein